MNPDFFLRGLLIGFSIAAPVGQIGVLCIRRTLTDGRIAGFVSGLGAATADAAYGAIAALGLTAVSAFLVEQQVWLRLLGGVFLCYLGFRIFTATPVEQSATSSSASLTKAYTTTFLLTLANPSTILSFAAIFAGVGLGSVSGDGFAAVALVLGVFIGSALWWLILSGGVSLLRTRLTQSGLAWVNRGSGLLITAFGVLALLSLFALRTSFR